MGWDSKNSKLFHLVLFPDSVTYDCNHSLTVAVQLFDQYAFILHDSDIHEDGTPKKSHWHLIGRRAVPMRFRTVCDKLELPLECMTAPDPKFRSSFRSSFRYLLHLDNPDKYQYQLEQLSTNISEDEMKRYIEYDAKPSAESDALDSLLSFCEKNGWYYDSLKLLRFAQDSNILGYYHRWASIIADTCLQQRKRIDAFNRTE